MSSELRQAWQQVEEMIYRFGAVESSKSKNQRCRQSGGNLSAEKLRCYRFLNGKELGLPKNKSTLALYVEEMTKSSDLSFTALEPSDQNKGRHAHLELFSTKLGYGCKAYLMRANGLEALERYLEHYAAVTPLGLQTERTLTQTTVEIEASSLSSGYEPNAVVRKVIEQYAVAKARAYYERRGYDVTEKGKPYDLLCKKMGEVIHVEVKGSRSTLDAFILTANEISDARDPQWKTDLFLVDTIELVLSNCERGYQASGGRNRLISDWLPEDQNLTPIQYRYKLPSQIER